MAGADVVSLGREMVTVVNHPEGRICSVGLITSLGVLSRMHAAHSGRANVLNQVRPSWSVAAFPTFPKSRQFTAAVGVCYGGTLRIIQKTDAAHHG